MDYNDLTDEQKSALGCGLIIALIISLTLGGICFNYSLDFIFGKDIPWYGDALAGGFLSSIVVPTAIVCLVLDWCGVEHPITGGKTQAPTPPAKAPTTQMAVERT